MKMQWIAFLLSTSFIKAISADIHWENIQPGIYFTQIKSENVIAFKIDPESYHFQIALANPTAYIAQLALHKKALLAINGGYFSTENQPLGLRISDYQQLSTFKHISWWGVFYLKNNRPRIVANRKFKTNSDISFAIQAGPRLIAHNAIMQLRPGIAQRSAIGINKSAQVILASSKNNPMTLTHWAHLLQILGCKYALNLDGGNSTQLFANLPGVQLNIKNINTVSDAIIISSKE